MFLNDAQLEIAKKYSHPVYLCPHEKKPIIGLINDDKVLCNCGKGNPNVTEAMQRIETKHGLHYVSYLTRIH